MILLDYCFVFFFQAEDGIRDLVRSRGLGDVYKRQNLHYEYDIKNLPNMIVSDKKRLSQILYNLMHNAIKYTNSGFVKITAKLLSLIHI